MENPWIKLLLHSSCTIPGMLMFVGLQYYRDKPGRMQIFIFGLKEILQYALFALFVTSFVCYTDLGTWEFWAVDIVFGPKMHGAHIELLICYTLSILFVALPTFQLILNIINYQQPKIE